jgi:hypothetical protein
MLKSFIVDGANVADELERRYSAAETPARRMVNAWYARAGEDIWRDLSRYYTVLQDSLAELDLSELEAVVLIDALKGVVHSEATYRDLAFDVQEALRCGQFTAPPELDVEALAAKMSGLTAGAAAAVLDAIDRFRALSKEPENRDRRVQELLVEVGLVRWSLSTRA